jgi:hypothetical protein
MMPTETYVPADLQRRYRAILDEARAGEARVRDLDGTNLLLLPESRVEVLRQVSTAAANLATVEAVLESIETRRPAVSEYGEWSWLQVFDVEDLREFVRDIREAVVVGVRDESVTVLEGQLRDWRTTAEQANDPLLRSILAGGAAEEDFVEVRRPEATDLHQPGSEAISPGNGAE